MSNPPYHLTSEILNLVIEIAEKIGQINATFVGKSSLELRKRNKIKTIHSSLKIEGNVLTEDQVTALIEEKRVLGPQKDILEVTNAIEVYDSLNNLNPFDQSDFLEAHKVLTRGLVAESGNYRSGGVGIVKESEVAHIAPSAELVPGLMKDLFHYLKQSEDHDLVKAAVFHYELEFIHPFSDGNGRMGRLWNTLILMNTYPIFEFIPFESIIAKHQEGYYEALAESDKSGHSTPFILFMLHVLKESLDPFINAKEIRLDTGNRLEIFLDSGKTEFTRSDYLKFFKNISAATASRDLAKAVKDGLIEKSGDKRKTSYRKMN